MRKIIAILLFLLTPLLANGASGDIIVNNQSTYAVPPGTTKLLILDLTLPESLNSIKILNLGTVQHWDISAMYIFEDGASSGFDGDEKEIFRKSNSPFWDTELSVNSSNSRIFITVDIGSTVASGKTIKPKATINSDKTATGAERTILTEAPIPDVPQAPLAKSGEALSTTTIRWNFLDLANNEFGFRLKDNSLKTLIESQNSDLSYFDETGLAPNTCYSGRRVSAFNDRGEGSASMSFAEVCTPKEPSSPVVAPVATSTENISNESPSFAEATEGKATLFETIQTKIADIQRQINELLKQINELIKQSSATVFGALRGFLRVFFEK